jgi:hypothetical protein
MTRLSEYYSRKLPGIETLTSIWEELRKLGPEGIRDLLPLLADRHEWVRCWAAAHLLPSSPADAEPVLEALATAKGLAAMDARIILANWRQRAYQRGVADGAADSAALNPRD